MVPWRCPPRKPFDYAINDLTGDDFAVALPDKNRETND